MAAANDRHTAALVAGLLIGGATGAVYGLLNAPRPGAATRAALEAGWNDLLELTAEGIAALDNRVRARLVDLPAPAAVAPVPVGPAAQPTGDRSTRPAPGAPEGASGPAPPDLDVVVDGPRTVVGHG